MKITNKQVQRDKIQKMTDKFQNNNNFEKKDDKPQQQSQIQIQMNYRPSNYGNSYMQQPNRLGYSSVSRNNAYSNRNYPNEDQGYNEIEFMLENERKKFKQAKEKYQYDLDNERKMRIEFENKLIKLKDQFSRKDITISELEFKINNLLHQNQDIIVENERLKNELIRMEEIYGGKIHQLQTTLNMETRNFEETTLQYNTQFEKFKKEGQQYVEQLTFQFQRKIKNLQEKLKASENVKRDLSLQNKKLNDILINNKLNFEQEIRDLKNRSRDEEMKRTQNMQKSFEQKVKMIEESKDILNRKNQQLLRALQDMERRTNDLQGEKTEQVSRLREENVGMSQQLNQLNYLISKFKTELAEKDNLIGRSINDKEHELHSLRQQLENKRIEVADANKKASDYMIQLKMIQSESEKKRREWVDRANMFEAEARKYKDQYSKICDILKSKINDTINSAVVRR